MGPTEVFIIVSCLLTFLFWSCVCYSVGATVGSATTKAIIYSSAYESAWNTVDGLRRDYDKGE